MKVINLIAGPGAAKSTLGAGLFHHAKRTGYNVEFVSEYAKDMVWEQRANVLDDQLYILSKQRRRLDRLRESVDYVITDTSLFLCMFYARNDYFKSFFPLVKEVFDSFDNFNVWVQRPGRETYSETGRRQTYAEAVEIDDKLWKLTNTLSNIHMYLPAIEDPEVSWQLIVKESSK